MSGSSTNTAMEGAGYYNRNSSMQAAGIAKVLPVWEKLARTVPIGDGPLVIADYGSSQGRNSMAPVRTAITALREAAGADRAVQVVHTDLPSNDFASLFQTLDNDPDSYMQAGGDIYPSAIGRSYFAPILPPGTVHLGWNSWTLQWLSRNPAEVSDHILAAFAADEATQAAAQMQAAQDWRDFVAARASELHPGAPLLCLFAAMSGDGRSWRWLFGEIWGALTDLSSNGQLSGRELSRMTMPLFGRSLSDIKAPFGAGPFAGMALEAADVMTSPDPFWPDYQKTGDARELGRSWAGIWRGALGPSLAACLEPGRDAGGLLDAAFTRFAERVADAPQEVNNAVALVVLRRVR